MSPGQRDLEVTGVVAQRSWTDFDDGLLHTLWVTDAMITDRVHRLQLVNPPFAVERGERVFTRTPFQLSLWAAPGDGSYRHDSSFVLASGRGGMALTAGSMAFRAAGNRRRRREAELAAVPRWLPALSGSMWISDQGFRLESTQGLAPWGWGSVAGLQVGGQGVLQVQVATSEGPASWQLRSPQAELLFALWVLQRQVPHPQWMDRSWIPPRWIPWARSLGRPTPYDDADELSTALPPPREG